MPNIRTKLPSRNWLIFLSITGTFASFILYDKSQKKRVQQKWCRLVSHLAQEPLDTRVMPRKVTIYLAAPPDDGLRASREFFVDYVKPILVAGALDWDVVEGRQEGEVQAGLAERIRKLRERVGERSSEAEAEEDVVEELRRKSGVQDWPGVKGDIILGRHTWKEYVRGLHEGWLGPLDPPPLPADETTTPSISSSPEPTTPLPEESLPQPSPEAPPDDSSPLTPPPIDSSSENPKKDDRPKPPSPTPFIHPSAYSSAPLPPSIPDSFEPCAPIPFPHVLGFLNTPTRIYRFLNRRLLADEIGRQTAAVVLASHTTPYDSTPSSPSSLLAQTDGDIGTHSDQSELQRTLASEERDWPKSVRQRKEEGREHVWLEDIVLDGRIVRRMRKFELGAGRIDPRPQSE